MCISIAEWYEILSEIGGFFQLLSVFGFYEYLERLEGKLESAYSFRLNFSKITVWTTILELSVSS